ncbi:hypothetical protein SPRG_12741 [Saprolegnia parasitica CBS 223.65]|uniref:Uncharacterized protein n=1 Tax=Saprolegnia parasitica (strain CBS 223.65) TaxID=695850 RepID=A0A067C024_SAPPC|nr:hypothetical protein SPRG_12741 [Saprolegnia parasitica CBS 223.65]KDO22460.1 hypothetical protein SPRG_12741 [Saprolegnia parasitica CBS 223.65]|eukprot:XP_012206848.1 hypothetical protein SPRG_12741 [Saprolegnia parasitica CBS 223.65]
MRWSFLLALPSVHAMGIYFFWVSNVRIGSRMQCDGAPKHCPGDFLAYRREALHCEFEACKDATHPPGYVPTPAPTPAPTDAKFVVIAAYTPVIALATPRLRGHPLLNRTHV